MDFAEKLSLLEQTQGDPVKQVLVTVDLVYPQLPDSDKKYLKDALQAAAIPHWCDETILAALLQIPMEHSFVLLEKLRKLNVVEDFSARGPRAINVHETSRLDIRKHLFKEGSSRFIVLTEQAAMYFAKQDSLSSRIEWIYHLLCSNFDKGADELEKLYRAWSTNARPEALYALALVLQELEEGSFLQMRARLLSLITIAYSRQIRGEISQLLSLANRILLLSRQTKDKPAE